MKDEAKPKDGSEGAVPTSVAQNPPLSNSQFVFGGNTSSFGANAQPPSTSGFGGSPPASFGHCMTFPNPTGNGFGGISGLFGAPSSSGGLFGNPAPSSGGSLFASRPPPESTSNTIGCQPQVFLGTGVSSSGSGGLFGSASRPPPESISGSGPPFGSASRPPNTLFEKRESGFKQPLFTGPPKNEIQSSAVPLLGKNPDVILSGNMPFPNNGVVSTSNPSLFRPSNEGGFGFPQRGGLFGPISAASCDPGFSPNIFSLPANPEIGGTIKDYGDCSVEELRFIDMKKKKQIKDKDDNIEINLSSGIPISSLLFEINSDIFTCCLCKKIPIPQYAVEHNTCGSLFCASCLKQYFLKNGSEIVPCCKASNNFGSLVNLNSVVYKKYYLIISIIIVLITNYYYFM